MTAPVYYLAVGSGTGKAHQAGHRRLGPKFTKCGKPLAQRVRWTVNPWRACKSCTAEAELDVAPPASEPVTERSVPSDQEPGLLEAVVKAQHAIADRIKANGPTVALRRALAHLQAAAAQLRGHR